MVCVLVLYITASRTSVVLVVERQGLAGLTPACARKHASSPAGDAAEGITLALVSRGSCMTHDAAAVAVTPRFVKRRVRRLVSAVAGHVFSGAARPCPHRTQPTPPPCHATLPKQPPLPPHSLAALHYTKTATPRPTHHTATPTTPQDISTQPPQNKHKPRQPHSTFPQQHHTTQPRKTQPRPPRHTNTTIQYTRQTRDPAEHLHSSRTLHAWETGSCCGHPGFLLSPPLTPALAGPHITLGTPLY